MNYQNSAFTVTKTVIELCGSPRPIDNRNKREVLENDDDIETDIAFEGNDHIPEEAKVAAIKMPTMTSQRDLVKAQKMRKSEFEKLISDIRGLGKNSVGFWTRLPYVMCDKSDQANHVSNVS